MIPMPWCDGRLSASTNGDLLHPPVCPACGTVSQWIEGPHKIIVMGSHLDPVVALDTIQRASLELQAVIGQMAIQESASPPPGAIIPISVAAGMAESLAQCVGLLVSDRSA
jgi:hypothetical protein